MPATRKIIFAVLLILFVAGAATLFLKFKKRASESSNFSVRVEDGLPPPSLPGQRAPSFEAITMAGQNYKYNPTQNERTLVVFWASWCPPCAEETPALIDFSKRHSNWQIVAVSNDSTEREIRDFFKIFPNLSQPNIAIVWDLERRVSNAYGVTGLPESFMIDQKGLLIQKFIGPVDWKKF